MTQKQRKEGNEEGKERKKKETKGKKEEKRKGESIHILERMLSKPTSLKETLCPSEQAVFLFAGVHNK